MAFWCHFSPDQKVCPYGEKNEREKCAPKHVLKKVVYDCARFFGFLQVSANTRTAATGEILKVGRRKLVFLEIFIGRTPKFGIPPTPDFKSHYIFFSQHPLLNVHKTVPAVHPVVFYQGHLLLLSFSIGKVFVVIFLLIYEEWQPDSSDPN